MEKVNADRDGQQHEEENQVQQFFLPAHSVALAGVRRYAPLRASAFLVFLPVDRTPSALCCSCGEQPSCRVDRRLRCALLAPAATLSTTRRAMQAPIGGCCDSDSAKAKYYRRARGDRRERRAARDVGPTILIWQPLPWFFSFLSDLCVLCGDIFMRNQWPSHCLNRSGGRRNSLPYGSGLADHADRAYGVCDESQGIEMRGRFIIDPDGSLQAMTAIACPLRTPGLSFPKGG
jgi:hypothetical protein